MPATTLLALQDNNTLSVVTGEIIAQVVFVPTTRTLAINQIPQNNVFQSHPIVSSLLLAKVTV